MPEKFNASEVYEMGVQIEKNGRDFYQAAADAAKEPSMKNLFQELADWEAKHIRIFEDLKKKLPPGADPEIPYDPEDQYHRYLRALAASKVFAAAQDPAPLTARNKSPQAVLRMAIGFEHDSVALYTSMEKIVPASLGKKAIGELVLEDLNHVETLAAKMAALKK